MIAFASAVGITSAADAACRPAQIRGDWIGMGISPDTTAWLHCEITVGTDDKGPARCRGSAVSTSDFGIWSFQVDRSCRLAGRNGGGGRFIGAMASDGETFTAIALDEGGGIGPRVIDKLTLFSFVFTRR